MNMIIKTMTIYYYYNGVYLGSDEKVQISIFLTDALSEVELIVEVIDALSCWTAHVLVMMLHTQE